MQKCAFKTIAINRYGFASQCLECGKIHLGFGTFVLAFQPENIGPFLKAYTLAYQHYRNNTEGRLVKEIVIPTPSRQISMLFNLEEMEAFLDFMKEIQNAMFIKKLADHAVSGKGCAAFN
ncbi:MAG: DUF6686 family protein [Bacteroidota bacterium]